jgi:bifunctional UDP-N-acetylglucosamine pyrophosphorylase/glucosamine-1-phosphate N-acetyltransferase
MSKNFVTIRRQSAAHEAKGAAGQGNEIMSLDCIVLAAGLGMRMKSAVPKVLHRAAGRSLIGHVLAATRTIGTGRVVVVIGPDMDAVATETRRFAPEARIATQPERKGTAHALGFAAEHLQAAKGTTLVLYGDVPLIAAHRLKALANRVSQQTALAVLAFRATDPQGYGRLILDDKGDLQAIREERDASTAEREIDLCNSGVMAVRSDVLWRLLPQIGCNNSQKEYYLTDLVGLVRKDGLRAGHEECPQGEVQGVNTRVELAAIEAALQTHLRAAAMLGGVTLIAPETVFFSMDTELGRDVTVEPHVIFGPGVTIADGATIRSFCHLESCRVEAGAIIGPFARLRPGAAIGRDAHIGNFVEVKNAEIGAGAKANHLAYIGDASVGEKANIGAGTITCNYDGFAKHRTEIGAGAFIGTNASLVAPVKIGDGAYIGSGSVITQNVPAGALALERAELVIKQGWADKRRQARAAQKKS